MSLDQKKAEKKERQLENHLNTLGYKTLITEEDKKKYNSNIDNSNTSSNFDSKDPRYVDWGQYGGRSKRRRLSKKRKSNKKRSIRRKRR